MYVEKFIYYARQTAVGDAPMHGDINTQVNQKGKAKPYYY